MSPRTTHEAGLLPAPSSELRVVELGVGTEPLLQRSFEENPLYCESVNGETPPANEAHEEIHGALPADWSYTKKWVIGYADTQGSLVAMTTIVSDLLAPAVWHISTFIVATSRYGNGDAQARVRADVRMGRLSNTRRVMFKPLAGGSLTQYLTLVKRDRPED